MATMASGIGAAGMAVASAAQANATSSTTTSSSSTTATGSNITSSDFLTLLVSELKNQDPTQPTDPNAYIQQLVGVNSLQELISIDNKV
jgi:flagellar basal-body rod modification protein FlgD